MSRKQWGHGYKQGRLHERLNQMIINDFPRFLDGTFGKKNWFFDDEKKVYVTKNPRYSGQGIGYLVITQPCNICGEMTWREYVLDWDDAWKAWNAQTQQNKQVNP